MSALVPVCRHLIVCERVDWNIQTRKPSLVNPLTQVAGPSRSTAYPASVAELWLFALLTDATGALDFPIELVHLPMPGRETLVAAVPAVTLTFTSRLQVYGFSRRLTNVRFPQPGLYEFRLKCLGHVLAAEPLVVG